MKIAHVGWTDIEDQRAAIFWTLIARILVSLSYDSSKKAEALARDVKCTNQFSFLIGQLLGIWSLFPRADQCLPLTMTLRCVNFVVRISRVAISNRLFV